jgi:hypothetical protein
MHGNDYREYNELLLEVTLMLFEFESKVAWKWKFSLGL